MKNKITFISIIMLLIFNVSYSQSQRIVETRYFSNNKELGGDILIKKSIKQVVGKENVTTFEITAPGAGNYHLSTWVLPTLRNDGSYTMYEVSVNGAPVPEKITPHSSGWQSIKLSITVSLKAGLNTISFSAPMSEVAEIEFIRLSTAASKAAISSSKYNDYIAGIESVNFERKSRARNVQAVSADTTAMLRGPSANPDWMYTNPLGNYDYFMNLGFGYTFYKTVYFDYHQEIFVATDGVDNCGHFLEIFSVEMPEIYTWATRSNANCLASLVVTIPKAGYYYIKVRTDRNATSGFTNVNINGENYYERVPITSMGYRSMQDNQRVYNSFTCHSTGDPILWIERGPGIPGVMVAYDDDYGGTGDYQWENNARVKQQFLHGTSAVLISAYGSYNPAGKCDMYSRCMNSAIYPLFENLKPDDAIQSAPESPDYNCISWSGGVMHYWEWPPYPYSEYYIPGDEEGSFNNFYSDANRYPGCSTFSQEGATEANSVIDLYAVGNGDNREYTHASITKDADLHTHGYDWESKPGGFMRTFHPRYALEGINYGRVVNYYRKTSGDETYSLDEAIADGKAVIENVQFSNLEKSMINAQKDIMSSQEINTFNSKYNLWKQAFTDSPWSNPNKFFTGTQFNDLLNFCQTTAGTNYLAYEKLGEGDFMAMFLIDKLTLTNIRNNMILDGIKVSNSKMKVTPSGARIVRSPYSNSMTYVKKLLTGGMISGKSAKGSTDIRYSNTDDFNTVVNGNSVDIDFTLSAGNSNISLYIRDLNGRLVSGLVNNQTFSGGSYHYSVPLSSGMYLVSYTLDGNVNVKKVIIK